MKFVPVIQNYWFWKPPIFWGHWKPVEIQQTLLKRKCDLGDKIILGNIGKNKKFNLEKKSKQNEKVGVVDDGPPKHSTYSRKNFGHFLNLSVSIKDK